MAVVEIDFRIIIKMTTVIALVTMFSCIVLLLVLLRFIYLELFMDDGGKYTLGLLVQAKNEGMVIEEFIDHYLWQGVEKIYLIDNGSTDDMRKRIEPYVSLGKVEYFFRPQPYKQFEHYNEVYKKVRNECKWVIVCDADEYIYNRAADAEGGIRKYLEGLDYEKVGVIYVQWKMFGSSGWVEQPEGGIRKSFLWRAKDINAHTKAIVNTRWVKEVNIHVSDCDESKEVIHAPEELALNHYAIMSREYFEKVKMSRGDATQEHLNNFRDWSYFERYDTNEVEDLELADMLKGLNNGE